MNFLESVPPSSNTGAQTERTLLDWIAVTFPGTWELSDLFDIMRMDGRLFVPMPNGLNGYNTQLVCGHIKVLTDGRDDMGHHVIFSGEGVREYEQGLITGPSWTIDQAWKQRFSEWLSHGARFTRIDVARDTGMNITHRLIHALRHGHVTTRFRDYRILASGGIQDDEKHGLTLYMGSPQSLCKIRVYDKGAQKGLLTPWHRMELEMRNERAHRFVECFIPQEIGHLWSMVVNQYMAVRVPSAAREKYKWPLDDWWVDFLATGERAKLTSEKPEKTLPELEKWFRRAMAPTMSVIFEYAGGDMDYLKNLCIDGFTRRSPRHLAMLKGDIRPWK